MWEELLDDHDLDVSVNGNAVDLAGSYLVGDAAGREGDFSDTDRYTTYPNILYSY